jgi:hypothetical protein
MLAITKGFDLACVDVGVIYAGNVIFNQTLEGIFFFTFESGKNGVK